MPCLPSLPKAFSPNFPNPKNGTCDHGRKFWVSEFFWCSVQPIAPALFRMENAFPSSPPHGQSPVLHANLRFLQKFPQKSRHLLFLLFLDLKTCLSYHARVTLLTRKGEKICQENQLLQETGK